MWGVQTLGLSENATHLAYGDGRVYVMSNLGALAALDAYNGTILWLNIYPRSVSQAMDPQMGFNNWALQQVNQGGTKPWSFNPVIVHQGKLFALWDGAPPYGLDPVSLETRGRLKLRDAPSESRSCASVSLFIADPRS